MKYQFMQMIYILYEGINQLLNILNKNVLNEINVNKKKVIL